MLRLDASAADDHLLPLVVKQGEHLFGDEEQVTLHQSNGNGGDDGLQDAHSGGVRQCLFAAALVLLRFEVGIGLRWLLLRMMHRAIRLGANPPQFSLVDAVRDDGIGGILARFELRPLRLLRGVGLVRPDLDVLAAGNDLAAFLLLAVGRADLDKFWLGRDLLLNVRLQLCRIAGRIGALCGIWANCKSFLLALRRRADRVSRFEWDCEWLYDDR